MLFLATLILTVYLINEFFAKIYKNRINKFNIISKLILPFCFAILACILFSILFPLFIWTFSLFNNDTINVYKIIEDVVQNWVLVFIISLVQIFIKTGYHNKNLLLNKEIPQVDIPLNKERILADNSVNEKPSQVDIRTPKEIFYDAINGKNTDFFVLGNRGFPHPPKTESELNEIINFVALDLRDLFTKNYFKSRNQLFHYVACELDGAAQGDNEYTKELIQNSGFTVDEYKNALNTTELMDVAADPLSFMDGKISPQLRGHFSFEDSIKIRCLIVSKFIENNRKEINEGRIAAAKFITFTGNEDTKRKWTNLIEEIERKNNQLTQQKAPFLHTEKPVDIDQNALRDGLLQSLRVVLEDDKAVIPALISDMKNPCDIPVPESAIERQIHIREINIANARSLISSLKEITKNDSETIIWNALLCKENGKYDIDQSDIIKELYILSKCDSIKRYKMTISSYKVPWSESFNFSENEFELAQKLTDTLYHIRKGDLVCVDTIILNREELLYDSKELPF